MKAYHITAALAMVLVVTGAGCSFPWKKEEPTVQPANNVAKISVKREYEQNVGIWIEEMTIQIGKLKAYRPNIAAANRESFDGRVLALELQFDEFKKDLEDFKKLPRDDFFPGRAVVNQSLDVVWNMYSKIVADFEVKFEEQP